MKNFDINNLVRDNVKVLKPYSSARDEFEDFDTANMVFLDANENPYQNGVNRYPDPQQSSVKAVLAKNKGLNTNQILLGNGSDEVLDLLFRAFCEPKEDNVISLPPTYGMYGVLANINNVEHKEIILSEAFQPRVDAILEAVTPNTKIDHIGPIAKLDKIQYVTGLPKTRSGKIMRRILRKIAEGDYSNFGDITTLLNPEIVDEIVKGKI